MKCNLCESGELEAVITFRNTPIVNNYQKEKYGVTKTNSEILFCAACQSIKNAHNISPDKIFENYSYSSFQSKLLGPIEKYIAEIYKSKNLKSITEVGCNNGVFLENISELTNCDHILGIDPSSPKNNKNQINFIKKFFSEKVIKDHNLIGKSDLIIARHMFAHVPNPEKIAKELALCASKNSYIYIENANLENTISKKDYSQLYLEHFYALSPKSIERIFSRYGFKIESVKKFSIHNGSFGVLLKKTSEKESYKLTQKTYDKKYIHEDIKKWLNQCEVFFNSLERNNNYIWGVTAKTVMMLNMLNINTNNGKDTFQGAFDFTSLKIGCYIPGTNILISKEPETMEEDYCNVMIGARNFSEEIKNKIKEKMPNSNIIIPPF